MLLCELIEAHAIGLRLEWPHRLDSPGVLKGISFATVDYPVKFVGRVITVPRFQSGLGAENRSRQVSNTSLFRALSEI